MKIKQQSIFILALLICSFAFASFSMIYQPITGDNTPKEPNLRTSDSPWYESNDDYNIGDFPDNEWDSPWHSMVQVVQALTGQAIRMKSTVYETAYISRPSVFPITSSDSLYLSFKVQLDKYFYTECVATIELVQANDLNFLEINFDTNEFGDPRIDFRFPDSTLMHYFDFVLGQEYYFDIVFRKDPTTNKMKYLIFMDQKLEFTTDVDAALYPMATSMNLFIKNGGEADFFIDNFYLGYVDNDVSDEYETRIAYPMYYLFAPEYDDVLGDYIEEVNLKFEYIETQTTDVTYYLTVGGSVASVLDCSVPTPLSEYVELSSANEYEVSTNEEDVIIFTRVVGDVKDITIDLPGVHPDTGTSEMCGWYYFNFISSKITSSSESFFEIDFGSLPDDFEGCKSQTQKDKTIILASEGGNQGNYEKIGEYLYEYYNTYLIGVGIGIGIAKYLSFDFGMTYSSVYTHTVESNVEIAIQWENYPPNGEMAQFDVYKTLEGVYPSSFYFPPYSVEQVDAKVTGLTATGGDRRVTLNWNAISGSTFSHYNIYRVISGSDVKIGTSTSNSYVHTGLGYSTWYTYKVSAVVEVDGVDYETSKSNPASARTDYGGGGDVGCPFLNVFNGVEFIEEGLLDIHDPDGLDLIYEHELITQPARVGNRYLLRLIEHPLTISHIDKVSLYGQLSNGRMIRLPFLSAIHSEEGQVRFLLRCSDDRKVIELGADHNNGISQMIDLEFYAPKWISFTRLVFIIEGNNMLVK